MKFLYIEAHAHAFLNKKIFTEDELIKQHGGWMGESTHRWIRNVRTVGSIWSICAPYVLVTVDDDTIV